MYTKILVLIGIPGMPVHFVTKTLRRVSGQEVVCSCSVLNKLLLRFSSTIGVSFRSLDRVLDVSQLCRNQLQTNLALGSVHWQSELEISLNNDLRSWWRLDWVHYCSCDAYDWGHKFRKFRMYPDLVHSLLCAPPVFSCSVFNLSIFALCSIFL